MAYPLVAALAGFCVREVAARRSPGRPRRDSLAEIWLFAVGLTWLAIWAGSFKKAFFFGLYWFVFAEVIKVLMAAAVAVRVKRTPKVAGMSPTQHLRKLTQSPIGDAMTREITVAHSPDSDDAFMFYGLATNKVRVPGLRFTHTLCDIETLNRKAQEGVYDVTAISFHAYPYIQDHYALLPSGGSVGDGYGPMIVATRAFTQSEIKRKRIAVPGKLTTAYLALEALRARDRSRSRALRSDHSRRCSRANTKPD